MPAAVVFLLRGIDQRPTSRVPSENVCPGTVSIPGPHINCEQCLKHSRMEKWYTYCVNKTPRQVSNNLHSTAQVTTPSSLLTDMQDCTSSIRHARDPWSRQDWARTLSTEPKATVSLSKAGQSMTDRSSLNVQYMERNTDYGGPLLIAIGGQILPHSAAAIIPWYKCQSFQKHRDSRSHDLTIFGYGMWVLVAFSFFLSIRIFRHFL